MGRLVAMGVLVPLHRGAKMTERDEFMLYAVKLLLDGRVYAA
jgi:hypothetical protein